MPGNAQGSAGNDSPISHDGGYIWSNFSNSSRGVSIHFGSANDLDAKFLCSGGNGRRRQDAFASQRCVRAGEDSDDVEPGVDKGVERRHGDSGGPGEENPHGVIPKLDPPKLVPTLFARLVVVCSVMAS